MVKAIWKQKADIKKHLERQKKIWVKWKKDKKDNTQPFNTNIVGPQHLRSHYLCPLSVSIFEMYMKSRFLIA